MRNTDRIEYRVLTLPHPFEYKGEEMCGVLEIYYNPKHCAKKITMRSIPVPQTNPEFIKGVFYYWLSQQEG
jgi:hypothetical protein